MENLKQPVQKVLLNFIDYTKVGAYYDSEKAVNMLSFKQYGINIPYTAGAFSGAKTVTNNGTLQTIAMQLSAVGPCNDCNWDYNVKIVKKVQFPGVNNIETNFNSRSYNGTINKVTTTGGMIDDKWLLAAEDDIINQITSDTGMQNTNPDPITGGGSCVNAFREYKVTMSANTVPVTDTISITSTINGVTTTTVVAGTGAGTLLTFLAVINAQTAVTGVKALGVDTTAAALGTEVEVLLQSNTPGQLFYITIGGTTVSIDYRRILFVSKTARTQFAVQYYFGNLHNQPAVPQILFHKGQYIVDASTLALVPNSGISLFINGVEYDVNTAGLNTVATVTAAINIAVATNHAYATAIGTSIFINSDDTVTTFAVEPSVSTATYVSSGYYAATPYQLLPATFDQWGNILTGALPMTPKGRWPIMLGSEVFQKFERATDPGSVPFQNYEHGDPYADYVCYFIKVYSTIAAASGGASTLVEKESIVEVYIKKSLLTTAFLRAVAVGNLSTQTGAALNQAPVGAANITFEELLQYWAGGISIVVATGAVTGGLNPNAWTN